MSGTGEQCYRARLAATCDDVKAAQHLRQRCFGGPHTPGAEGDQFDAICQHLLVEEQKTGRLVSCCRLLRLASGAEIGKCYSAQYYELSGLQRFDAPMLEVGRFCIDANLRDADILRVAWGALARFVDQQGVRMLFGCSSFRGTDLRSYQGAFALLQARHLAPKRWRPGVRDPNVVRFSQVAPETSDERQAAAKIPPLLRSYLAMGGWVSDHAVVDAEMNSLHVFTGLEIAAIPAARARLLRAAAGTSAMA